MHKLERIIHHADGDERIEMYRGDAPLHDIVECARSYNPPAEDWNHNTYDYEYKWISNTTYYDYAPNIPVHYEIEYIGD